MVEDRKPYNPFIKEYSQPIASISTKLLPLKKYPQNNFVYFIRESNSGIIKIGEGWNPFLRMKGLQVGNPRRLSLVAIIFDPEHIWEVRIHSYFKKNHIRGEWFKSTKQLSQFINWLKIHALKTIVSYDDWQQLHDTQKESYG